MYIVSDLDKNFGHELAFRFKRVLWVRRVDAIHWKLNLSWNIRMLTRYSFGMAWYLLLTHTANKLYSSKQPHEFWRLKCILIWCFLNDLKIFSQTQNLYLLRWHASLKRQRESTLKWKKILVSLIALNAWEWWDISDKHGWEPQFMNRKMISTKFCISMFLKLMLLASLQKSLLWLVKQMVFASLFTI